MAMTVSAWKDYVHVLFFFKEIGAFPIPGIWEMQIPNIYLGSKSPAASHIWQPLKKSL